jgi:hypothetical protein
MNAVLSWSWYTSAANVAWMVHTVAKCDSCSATFQSNNHAGASHSGGSWDTSTSSATYSASSEKATDVSASQPRIARLSAGRG